jgi:hypothetical protein
MEARRRHGALKHVAAALDGGCRTNTSAERRGALAEVHARAASCDDLAMDRPATTDEMAVFRARA